MIYLFVSWDEGIPFAFEPVSANFINAIFAAKINGTSSKSAIALDASLQQLGNTWKFRSYHEL